jgi:hypothetical protein
MLTCFVRRGTVPGSTGAAASSAAHQPLVSRLRELRRTGSGRTELSPERPVSPTSFWVVDGLFSIRMLGCAPARVVCVAGRRRHSEGG